MLPPEPVVPRRVVLWLHLALILVVAAIFRLWRLDAFPPGLFGDEATNGLDALDVLAGRGAVFFPANYGREGLHVWIVAGAFRLFDVVPLALRLPSAVAGILTALATYWLGHELVRSLRLPVSSPPTSLPAHAAPRAGSGLLALAVDLYPTLLPLGAALYIAASFPHVHFSRFGIRGVFTPLCGALAFAAFWHAVNQSRRDADRRTVVASYAAGGLFLGLSLHFYTAGRFLPVFLAGFLALEWLLAARARRAGDAILSRDWRPIGACVIVAALVFAPLGLYFVQHPGSFTQRAGTVAAFGGTRPWTEIGRAAAANVLQFAVPGRGDQAQFYNLPGRPVFDTLTALLAIIGLLALVQAWRRPAAAFILLWCVVLLLPSFLATDRYPTLPRILGTLPGIYYLPAAGALVVAALIADVISRRVTRRPAADAGRRPPGIATAVALLSVAAALVWHGTLTYRDYFHTWGPSQATYDAFDGDMTAAWRWLQANVPQGHVYLSSDIYKHPTFMLLHERTTVTGYIEQHDPDLSWFDGRAALPFSPPSERATYLIGAGAPLEEPEAAGAPFGPVTQRVLGPDGYPALTIISTSPVLMPAAAGDNAPEQPFMPELALATAGWDEELSSVPLLRLSWRTAGRRPPDWGGYRLQIEGIVGGSPAWQETVAFDAFRPPEWVTGGGFLTWHALPAAGREPASTLRLRLVRVEDGVPVASPASPDGWHSIETSRWIWP